MELFLPEPELLQVTEDYLVVNKPAGVLTQAPPGIDSLELRLRQWKQRQTGESQPYIGVPHRLDRPVSGVMVFGQTPKATRRLGDQFQCREVKKYYWALVAGTVAPSVGTWTDFMRKIPDEPRSEIVSAEHPEGQVAILHYRLLATDGQWSMLQIELETGRTHQIRLQCSHHGVPILGDDLYGSELPFGEPTDDQRARAIALHAQSLIFYEHRHRRRVSFRAALPSVWDAPLSKLPKFGEME